MDKVLTLDLLREKKTLVVGLGRSGRAAVSLLTQLGCEVKATDIRGSHEIDIDRDCLTASGIEVELGGHSIEFASDCDILIVSPGVPLDNNLISWALTSGRIVASEIELAYSLSDAHFIAITGTNGKTTTVSLLGEIFKKAGRNVFVAGNIGSPISAFVQEMTPDSVAVVEVSSFQLDTCISFTPDIGVLLNVTPDHLDRYATFEDYIRSKGRLFSNQGHEDIAILNADDQSVLRAANEAKSQKYYFSISKEVDQGIFVKSGDVVARVSDHERVIFNVKDLRIEGPHNLANSLAATLAATLHGIDDEPIITALREFEGLEHRLELVTMIDGVRFINDSKATNVDSLRAALSATPGKIILIAGGRDKGGDFKNLKALVKQKVKAIIALGESSGRFRQIFQDVTDVRIVQCLEEGVSLAWGLASKGDTVLLSPGCASFDMFTNFEERGRVFKHAVLDLAKREKQNA